MSGHEEPAQAETTGGTSRVYTLGKYRVVAELARGGMGIVYLALARGPGAFSKLLVLKELKRDLAEDPRIVEMFMEEARLAACLTHPNVVQTVEAGSEGGRHYIAMEYLDGQSLHRVVSRAAKLAHPLPFAWRAAVLSRALEGLAYAHAAVDYEGKPLGIVHRDMSPHNVVVGYDGRVKVLDFGIAKATASSADTGTGVLKGKVAYMAPEQAAGGAVDGRTDIFAVGVMLWEAATGRRFWTGMENDVQILRALLDGQVGAYRDAAMTELPAALRHVIARATDAAPARRYANATQFLSELGAALASSGVPVLDPPAVGRLALELFTEDRAKLQASIEEALNRYRHPASGAFARLEDSRPGGGALPSLRSIGGDLTPSHVPILPSVSPNGAFASAIAPRMPVQAAPRPRLGRLGISLSIAAAGLATVAGFLALRQPAPTPSTPTPASMSPEASDVVAQGAEPSPPRIHVVVRGTPANARIVIDHQLVLDNPVVMTMARDGASHSIHVEADGYVPRDSAFNGVSDQTILIALDPRKGGGRQVGGRSMAPTAAQSATPPQVPANPLQAPAPTPASAPPTVGLPQRRINSANPYTE